jgi:hypothetical protein
MYDGSMSCVHTTTTTNHKITAVQLYTYPGTITKITILFVLTFLFVLSCYMYIHFQPRSLVLLYGTQ